MPRSRSRDRSIRREDDPPADLELRHHLHAAFSGLPEQTSESEAVRLLRHELALVQRTRISPDRRATTGAALWAIVRLLHRLDFAPENRAMFTEIINALVDADEGIETALTRPRRRERQEGRVPPPVSIRLIRPIATQSVGLLMHVGYKKSESAQMVGDTLEKHSVPVRRDGSAAEVAGSSGAVVETWRKRPSQLPGYPTEQEIISAYSELLSSMSQADAKRMILAKLRLALQIRGYRPEK